MIYWLYIVYSFGYNQLGITDDKFCVEKPQVSYSKPLAETNESMYEIFCRNTLVLQLIDLP
jgi:hypothetical protein